MFMKATTDCFTDKIQTQLSHSLLVHFLVNVQIRKAQALKFDFASTN